jgi:hypothetical protein
MILCTFSLKHGHNRYEGLAGVPPNVSIRSNSHFTSLPHQKADVLYDQAAEVEASDSSLSRCSERRYDQRRASRSRWDEQVRSSRRLHGAQRDPCRNGAPHRDVGNGHPPRRRKLASSGSPGSIRIAGPVSCRGLQFWSTGGLGT